MKPEWKIGKQSVGLSSRGDGGDSQQLKARRAVSQVLSQFEEFNDMFAKATWWRSCEEEYPKELDNLNALLEAIAGQLNDL